MYWIKFTENDYTVERLGAEDTPRPILVKLKDAKTRNEICKKTNSLQNLEGYSNKVYVKRDLHPSIRKEQRRLRKVVKDERARPENQACNIVYDFKNGVVTKDDTIIDRYCPIF